MKSIPMILGSTILVMLLMMPVPILPAQSPGQSSTGNCSPNIVNTGPGTVILQLQGANCQNIESDPAIAKALNQMNKFLANYPKEQTYLLKMLDITTAERDEKNTQLKEQIQKVAELTVKYAESQKQLDALGRPDHIAKMIKMNQVSAQDRKAMDATIRDMEEILSKTNFELTPDHLAALGWYCIGIARYDKAVAFFLDATEKNPSIGLSYMGLSYALQLQGYQYLQNKDADHAEQVLEKAEGYAKIAGQYDQFDVPSLVQLAYTERMLAQVYSEKGMPDKSRAALEKAARNFRMGVAADPKDPGAHNGLGDSYSDNGDFEHAIGEYATAVSLEPRYIFAWYDMSLALRQVYGSPGQTDEQNLTTLRKLLTAMQKVGELSQDENGQQLPPEAMQNFLDMTHWAVNESAKYKQASRSN